MESKRQRNTVHKMVISKVCLKILKCITKRVIAHEKPEILNYPNQEELLNKR